MVSGWHTCHSLRQLSPGRRWQYASTPQWQTADSTEALSQVAVIQHCAVVLWRVQVEILAHSAACKTCSGWSIRWPEPMAKQRKQRVHKANWPWAADTALGSQSGLAIGHSQAPPTNLHQAWRQAWGRPCRARRGRRRGHPSACRACCDTVGWGDQGVLVRWGRDFSSQLPASSA